MIIIIIILLVSNQYYYYYRDYSISDNYTAMKLINFPEERKKLFYSV